MVTFFAPAKPTSLTLGRRFDYVLSDDEVSIVPHLKEGSYRDSMSDILRSSCRHHSVGVSDPLPGVRRIHA